MLWDHLLMTLVVAYEDEGKFDQLCKGPVFGFNPKLFFKKKPE